MYYGEIKKCDIANGVGVRVSLFVSGCTHHCKGCFNPETWDFKYGSLFDERAKSEVLSELKKPFVTGLSLLGGEPMEPQNQEAVLDLLRAVKVEHPKKTVWCYTGYLLDIDLIQGGRAFTQHTDEILEYIDVLVDGEFVEELKDITLNFRGSSNQRIINMKETRRLGAVTEL